MIICTNVYLSADAQMRKEAYTKAWIALLCMSSSAQEAFDTARRREEDEEA
ncbi:MAG: hypothetical protein IJW40_02840 [Clostridia bacterium]|nr:hypothetical protein [Clostridia bacterium]